MSSLPAPTASRVDAGLGSVVSSRRVRELERGRPIGFQTLEPGFVAAFAGVWPHADSPAVAAITDRVCRRAGMLARLDAALEVPMPRSPVWSACSSGSTRRPWTVRVGCGT